MKFGILGYTGVPPVGKDTGSCKLAVENFLKHSVGLTLSANCMLFSSSPFLSYYDMNRAFKVALFKCGVVV